MKKIGLLLAVAAVLLLATDAGAVKNANGKWALHYAGIHNTKVNTCGFTLDACGSVVVTGPAASVEYQDIYIIAVDVAAISGARFGLECDGVPVFVNSWTKCSDFEIPETGWPACGTGNALTWSIEQPGPHVTIGILEIYVYVGSNNLATGVDPRTGKAEWCDGSEPSPICFDTDGSDSRYFGIIDFNGAGGNYSPCGVIPTQGASWGQVKSLYR